MGILDRLGLRRRREESLQGGSQGQQEEDVRQRARQVADNYTMQYKQYEEVLRRYERDVVRKAKDLPDDYKRRHYDGMMRQHKALDRLYKESRRDLAIKRVPLERKRLKPPVAPQKLA